MGKKNINSDHLAKYKIMANQTIQSSALADDEIDLGKLFGILIDAKWFIISITLFFATLGIAVAVAINSDLQSRRVNTNRKEEFRWYLGDGR